MHFYDDYNNVLTVHPDNDSPDIVFSCHEVSNMAEVILDKEQARELVKYLTDIYGF